MLLTILIFIFILGLLVFVHEFGHFIVAKRRGVGVEEFGFGFPPRLIGIKRGETIYSLNLIPLGGFVRIVGEAPPRSGDADDQREDAPPRSGDADEGAIATEDAPPRSGDADEGAATKSKHEILAREPRAKRVGEQATEDATGGEGRATEASGEASQIPGTPDRSFATRSFGERAAIVMAGIIGNVLLAAVLFSIAHGIGVATVVEGDETGFRNVAVTIVSVAPGSPAAEGGLKSGDNIVRIVDARGERLDPVRRVEEVQEFIQAHRGEPLGLSIERAKSTEELTVLPRLNAPEGEGALGIAMVRTGIRSYPWYEAVIQGVLTTIAFTELLVVGLASLFAALFTQGKLIADVAGPVGIAMLSREALLAGFAQLIFFTGVLSLNLGIINAFPFPALDGGRFMLLVIERLRGVPLSQRAETVIHTTGFAVLMLLMAAVTWRDIARIL